MIPPDAPPNVPIIKPTRRPYFCIISDNGFADSIDPRTINDMGKVAKQVLVASDCPASPPMIKIITIWFPTVAWARIKIIKLWRAKLFLLCLNIIAKFFRLNRLNMCKRS